MLIQRLSELDQVARAQRCDATCYGSRTRPICPECISVFSYSAITEFLQVDAAHDHPIGIGQAMRVRTDVRSRCCFLASTVTLANNSKTLT